MLASSDRGDLDDITPHDLRPEGHGWHPFCCSSILTVSCLEQHRPQQASRFILKDWTPPVIRPMLPSSPGE
jgi:hypothetical protein